MSNPSPWKAFVLRHWRRILSALLLAGIAIVLMLGRFEHVPNFSEFEAGAKRKSEFFTYLRPLVSEANSRILDDRRRLELLAENSHQGWLDRRWLESLAGEYGIEDARKLNDKGLITRLRRHVDIVPMSLRWHRQQRKVAGVHRDSLSRATICLGNGAMSPGVV
jgi:hypothetical protein